MAKLLINTTVADVPVDDCGFIVPASSTYTSTPGEWHTMAKSIELSTLIDAGTLVVNDGYDNLSKELGKRHLREESVPRASAYIATASVLGTSNSTLTLTATSRLVNIFTGSTAGQIVKLPDARTLDINTRYDIWNTSTTSITVQNNSGTAIFLVAAAQKTWIVLQSIDTQAGTWLFEANYMGGTGGGNGIMAFGFDGNGSTGRWLESLTNIASNNTPYTIAGSKAIRSFSLGGTIGSNFTSTVTIYKNAVALDTVSLATQNNNTKLNLNHLLVDKDKLSAQITSGSIARPVLVLWL